MSIKDKVYNAINNYAEAYRNDDKELFLSLWHQEAIFEDPVGSEPCKGIEAISAFWDFAHPEGQSIHPNDVKITVCANEGILQATMQVRNKSNNTGMDIQVVDHFIVNDNGKILSGRAFWDESNMTIPDNLESFDVNLDEFKDRG
tara:strand:+ start:54 stop:488 length:435 start_codon:yes stop_codon:yes gene_type:complete